MKGCELHPPCKQHQVVMVNNDCVFSLTYVLRRKKEMSIEDGCHMERLSSFLGMQWGQRNSSAYSIEYKTSKPDGSTMALRMRGSKEQNVYTWKLWSPIIWRFTGCVLPELLPEVEKDAVNSIPHKKIKNYNPLCGMARENDGSPIWWTPVKSLIKQTISVYVTFKFLFIHLP